jgi:hypothetical protein
MTSMLRSATAAVVIPRSDCLLQTMFAESPVRPVAEPYNDAQILLDEARQHEDSQYCCIEAGQVRSRSRNGVGFLHVLCTKPSWRARYTI